MLARIQDNQFIYLDQVVPGIEECLIKWFSAIDPKARFASSSLWDGVCHKYSVKHQRLALPFLYELIDNCSRENIPLEIQDLREAPRFPAPQPDQITSTLLDGITLEDYQVNGLKVSCTEEIGIFDLTTGGGKTELIAALIKMYRCPTVVITEQIVVLNQIVERLSIRNVVHNNDIGLFCHGNMPDGNLVIVGSIQSLTTPIKPKKDEIEFTLQELQAKLVSYIEAGRHTTILKFFPKVLVDAIVEYPEGVYKLPLKYMNLFEGHCRDMEWDRRLKAYLTRFENARNIQEMVKKCDLLLVDEADLATNSQYSAMFRHVFKGRRRYGFSGTPFNHKKPVKNLILKSHLGTVIYKVNRETIQEHGRIIPVKCYWVFFGDPIDRFDSRAYDIALKEDIIENSLFHDKVLEIVSKFPNDGTLILVDTSPIEPLGRALEAIIPNSKFIFGKTSQKERDRILKSFESRELKVLIGSKILKRGLDLKGGVENLVIIGGGGDWSDLNQKIGRAVRVNKRGWGRVFGFFNLTNKYLYKHSRENLKAVVDMGYPTKVIGNGMEIDGDKFIKSRFSFRAKRTI